MTRSLSPRQPSAPMPLLTVWNAPTLALTCLMCGGYTELDPGQQPGAAARCAQCGTRMRVQPVAFPAFRGGSMTEQPNVGRRIERVPTLSAALDEDWA